MEFEININQGLNGNIIIEDYSREYDQYIPEDQISPEVGRYKYSQSKTINVVMKITTKEETSLTVLLHNHDQIMEDPTDQERCVYDLERTRVVVPEDGYYHLHHLVLPTVDWYNNVYLEFQEYFEGSFDTIYFINNDNTFRKVVGGVVELCDLTEIVNRNCTRTTIKSCVVDLFYLGFLEQCYINYCKKLFNVLASNCCNPCKQDSNELEYPRDFIWMLLNVIKYQVECKQYLESQRLLEMFNTCGGFCKQYNQYERTTGCGCA